jgi:hypothetical protein
MLNIEVISSKILSEEYSRPLCYDAVYIGTVFSPYFSRRSLLPLQHAFFFRAAEFSRITLTMEVASSSETSVSIYRSTQYLILHLPALLWKSQWHEFLFRNRMATDWLNIVWYEFMVGQMTDLPILVDEWLADVLTSIIIRCLMNFQLARLITDWIIEWWIKLCP